MLLWIGFALMTAAVLVAVLRPLARPSVAQTDAADAGRLDVYRHQLGELEADRARGVIDEPEAAAAKLEISRRLLTSAAAGSDPSPPAGRAVVPDRAKLALALAVVLPLATVAVYLGYGSPGSPSVPFVDQARLPPEQMRTEDLVARVEARLREHPEDGAGWDVIAPVYLRLGRFRDSATAYANASRLLGETAARVVGFAQASVLAANGIVTEDARVAFERVLKIDAANHDARFWLALAKEQDGKLADARADYQSLLAQVPAASALGQELDQRLADVTQRLAPRAAGARGPSAEDAAAAEKLSPAAREQMIAQMVDGLAQRLERDGRDLGGWQRLVNAYVVLGRTEQARKALAQARKTFEQDADSLAVLNRLATSLGLGS